MKRVILGSEDWANSEVFPEEGSLRKMTKKLPMDQKQVRKPIHTACGFCHEKHLQCDVGRPCQNCEKRNIGYLCRDKVRKTRKRSSASRASAGDVKLPKKELTDLPKIEGVHSDDQTESSTECKDPSVEEDKSVGDLKLKDEGPRLEKVATTLQHRLRSFTNLLNSNSNSFLHDPLIPNMLGSSTDVKEHATQGRHVSRPLDFDSMWTNEEYMKLNDITGLNDGAPAQQAEDHSEDPLSVDKLPPIRRTSSSQLFRYLNVDPSIPRSDSRPYISLDMTKSGSVNRLDNAKNDQSCNTDSSGPSPENIRKAELTPYKLRQLIKTPKDLFEKQHLIRPHNYRAAYKDLLRCLHRMFLGSYVHTTTIDGVEATGSDEELNQKSLLRKTQMKHIAKSIVERYAPIFVTLTSNMIEDDLLLQEIILQRTLLEFESMAKLLNCTPICIWRRSGEICFVSNEFSSLTGFSKKEVLNERRFITEFLDHQSVVDYYDLFHEYLAFGSNQCGRTMTSDGQAIFGKCNLLLHSGSFLKCACCWTVKRDNFNISLLVMGQFLPIFEVD